MKIEYLDAVDSTNRYIKKYLLGGEDVIVCARTQTDGMGTKGRTFLSLDGGVYLTALTFYENEPAENAFRVMTHAATAVCRAAARFGVEAEIKWPNDVLFRGRKLCGILIENALSDGFLRYSTVGIGLNVCNDLSALGGIAVNLSEAAGKLIAAETARETLIAALQEEDGFEDYLAFVRFLGEEVTVSERGRAFSARAERILPDGRLEICERGVRRALTAAEISLKIHGTTR